jgi:DNA-3-methyladenine glycosylase I
MSNASHKQKESGSTARCWWCGDDPQYVDYHDHEWGVPVDDDVRLFEKMCLEGFQAGLSWITILRKRESFRAAFSQFDFRKVARYRPSRVDRLLTDASIVRHRGKIESTINNAKRACELIDELGSLANLFWQFEPDQSPELRKREDVVASTKESTALSKELKRRGWRFVGPTTCYALMQATGMVNDHLTSCDTWSKIDSQRQEFQRPG